MQSKRFSKRFLTRLLYPGGIFFLLTGILLSSVSAQAKEGGSTNFKPDLLPVIIGLMVDQPTVKFDQSDTALCKFEAVPITVTGTYHIPSGREARLQLAYHIIAPNPTETEYLDYGMVNGDGTFSLTRDWPGIPIPYTPDTMVEIHFGANLLDPETGVPIVASGASLDYYWYPWVCEPTAVPSDTETPDPTATRTPKPTPTPTEPATETQPAANTLTPTPTEVQGNQETFTPTPTKTNTSSPSPTLTATETQQVQETFTPTPTEVQGNQETFTPTPTKTNTPSLTPTVTATETQQVQETFTPTPTKTNTPSLTPTLTATETQQVQETFTPTPTKTNTPSPTPTLTATETQQVQETFTLTPTEIQPNQETFTPTVTQVQPTVTATLPPTLTPTVTMTQPPIVQNSATPTLTLVPTFTPSPTFVLPSVTPSFTPTSLPPVTPSFTPTSLPPVTLSPICGYAGDYLTFWQVTNPTNSTVSFTWDSPSTGESGSGIVGPNTISYFSTNASSQVVRLFINGQLVSQQSAASACLVFLEPAYGCTPDNQIAWLLFNDNGTAVGFNWSLDNSSTSSGTIQAHGSMIVVFSPVGNHSFVVSWEIPPLGPRSMMVNTTMNSCSLVPTQTPSLVPTQTVPPAPTSTNTLVPTQTSTLPAPEAVPTFTLVPSLTATQQPGSNIVPTNTLVPSQTAAQPAPALIATFTLVPTMPQPAGTQTPVLIPVTGFDYTPSGRLELLSRVLINLGMLTLGLALLLTAGFFRPRR